MLIQLLIVVFALFAVGRAAWQFRRSKLTRSGFLFWFIFWVLVAVVAVLPQTAQRAASLLGVGRGADLVTYLSLALLFYLVFRLFTKIEDISREVTLMVRHEALDKMEKEHPDLTVKK